MKFTIFISFALLLSIIFLSGCTGTKSPQKPEINLNLTQKIPELSSNESQTSLPPPDDKNKSNTTNTSINPSQESKNDTKNKTASEIKPPPKPPPKVVQPPQSWLDTFDDNFDGSAINSSKYSMKLVGSGSIKQNDKIFMAGNDSEAVIRNILYTKESVDLTKDFKIRIDVNLDGIAINGEIFAAVGLEDRNVIDYGEKPRSAFCEISAGPTYGTIMRTSVSGDKNTEIPAVNGTLEMHYESAYSILTCTFAGKSVSDRLSSSNTDYVLTLRSGLRKLLISSNSETDGTGTFIATFDNLKVD